MCALLKFQIYIVIVIIYFFIIYAYQKLWERERRVRGTGSVYEYITNKKYRKLRRVLNSFIFYIWVPILYFICIYLYLKKYFDLIFIIIIIIMYVCMYVCMYITCHIVSSFIKNIYFNNFTFVHF